MARSLPIEDASDSDASHREPWKASLSDPILWSVLLGTLLLRVPFIYQPLFVDESPILRNASHFITERTIIPPHFSYPPLFSYLTTLAVGGWTLLNSLFSPLGPKEWALVDSLFKAPALVIGPRLLSLAFALWGAGLLWAMTGPLPLSFRILAVAIFAASPISIEYSGYALADVAVGTLALQSIWFALRFSREGLPRDAILAGVFIGLSAAMKYNGALSCTGMIAAAICAPGLPGRRFLLLALAGAASIVTFALLAPTWVLVPKEAWAGFRFESSNVSTLRMGEPPRNHLTMLRDLALYEPGLLAAFILGVSGLASRNWRKEPFVIGAMPLLTIITIGFWQKQDPNYFLPSLPLFAAYGAFGAAGLAGRFPWSRWLAPATLLVVGIGWLRSDAPSLWHSEHLMRSQLRETIPSDAIILRFGLYTPKVYTDEEIDSALNNLSPPARQIALERLTHHPRAAKEILHQDKSLQQWQTLLSEEADRLWILTTWEDTDRFRSAFERDDSPPEVAPKWIAVERRGKLLLEIDDGLLVAGRRQQLWRIEQRLD